MFYVNDHPIMAGDLEVLEELKSQLASQGIYKFAEFKEMTMNIQFNCPSHGDGQEKKPSCGVSIAPKDGVPIGTVHCFSCGYSTNLEGMISNCFGYDDNGMYGRDWLTRNFLTVSIESRKELIINLGRGHTKKVVEYIKEEELDLYRYYHDYMYKRKLTDDVIDKFDVGYDANFILKKGGNKIGCLTFPVRDINGNTLFIARRSVTTKLFHYPEGVDKPVYGIYELPKDVTEVIICESIINALTCWAYGKYAVALNGTGTEEQYEQLRRMPCRKFITALDPDKAGNNATIKLKKALSGQKLVTSYDIPTGKDINDLTKDEFDNLEELF